MIEYKLIKKQKGRLGLMVRGHANFAPPGKPDIVCASVSSACFMAVNGCISQVKSEDDIDVKYCRPGHFVFTVKDIPQTRALIDAVYLHLKNLSEQYPQCFKTNSEAG